MAGIESLIRWGAGVLGIPALATAAGIIATSKSAFETGMREVQKVSGQVQCLRSESHLVRALATILQLNRTEGYGNDHLFFGLSNYDGALKTVDSQFGDLYLIEIVTGNSGLDRGQVFLVWAKYGIAQSNVDGRAFKVVAELNKRGSTLSTSQLDVFYRALAQHLVQQQDRIRQLESSGIGPAF